MYTPQQFKMDEQAEIHAHVAANPFGCIVSTGADGILVGTHMPFLLDSERNVLLSHMARANPQWRGFVPPADLPEADQVLVVFAGPHCYVSLRWYAGEFNVPTWNYTAVHAYGRPTVIDDPARVSTMLDELVAAYEQPAPNPWRVDWSDMRNHRLTRGIVAFEIAVTRWEGKQKLNQNKSEVDRAGVIAALRTSRRGDDHAVADLMAAHTEALP